MNLLDRYIAKTILAAIGLVTLMLTGLQIFILFVNQLDTIGKANYGIGQATMFVLLQIPYQVYLFFPMASLLGCLIGLGLLANNRELVVMRASGMSIWQITFAVFKVAIFLIVLLTLAGETLIPKLSHLANDQKMQALSDGQSLRTARGVWLRHQNDFISIGSIVSENELLNVYQFHFDDQHELRIARQINQIERNEAGAWIAHDVSETRLYPGRTEAKMIPEMTWDVSLNPSVLSVASRVPDEMTLRDIRNYLRAQKGNQQNVQHFKFVYYQRLIQPFSTIVMMLLAIPFIFGPLRSSTIGYKILVGATVGFSFHILNRFFGPVSQVFQWPPEIAAFGPTTLFALLGIYLMCRMK